MRKISHKLGLILIFLFIVLMATIGHVFDGLYVNFYVDHIKNDLFYRGQSHANVLGEHFDRQTLQHVAIMEREVETTVVVLDKNGHVLITSNPISHTQKHYLTAAVQNDQSTGNFIEENWHKNPYIVTRSPIISNHQLKGTVIMFSPTAPIRSEIGKIHWTVFFLGISTIVISSFIILLFSKQITQPLIRIQRMTEQIAKGNYHVQLPIKGKDEITDLTIAINSMSKELLRYDTSRNEFLSNISHELRTPLMYIKGYADLLKQQRIQEPADIKKYTEIISDEILRLQHLVKDLFDLARYRDGNITLKKRNIDLVNFLKEIVDMARFQIESKQITLNFNSNEEELEMMIDPERFEQVMINLLENARTYTSENGHISVKLSKTNGITIEVQDDGIGIPKEEITYIWERFYRVEKSRSRNFGGSGLGLAITKEIVELHGGTMEVKSVEGEGTIFYIHLPIYIK